MKSPGRIHQDDNFDVVGFANETLEQLIGILGQDDPIDLPTIVYLKTSNKTWQKYFHDAGIGFWEDWGDIEIEEGEKVVDYGNLFSVKGQTILHILCRNTAITISLKNKDQIVLMLEAPESDDSSSKIIYMDNKTNKGN